MSSASVVNPQDTNSLTPGGFIETTIAQGAERQAMYYQLLGQGWSKREAAREAGYSAVKSQRPTRHVETPELRAKMQQALKRQGATYDKAARVVSEAMDAKVMATFEGNVTESDKPDHKARVQAARVTADLMGLTERYAGSANASTVTLTLAGPLAERFAEMLGPKVIEGE